MGATDETALEALAAALAPRVLRLLLERGRTPKAADTDNNVTDDEVKALLAELGYGVEE